MNDLVTAVHQIGLKPYLEVVRKLVDQGFSLKEIGANKDAIIGLLTLLEVDRLDPIQTENRSNFVESELLEQ